MPFDIWHSADPPWLETHTPTKWMLRRVVVSPVSPEPCTWGWSKRIVSLRPVWATQQVPDKPKKHYDKLYQKSNKKGDRKVKEREGKENSNVKTLCPGDIGSSCDQWRCWSCVPQEVCTICSHSWQFLVLSRNRDFLMIESPKLAVVQCPQLE